MSFNATVPLLIVDLRKRLSNFTYERMDLENRYHYCNCDQCPVEDPIDEDEFDSKLKELGDEELLVKKTVDLLILYAKEHNIEIPKLTKK